jgi:hypothetical protein
MVVPCDVQMPAICLELVCCESPEKVLLEVMRCSFLGDLHYRNRIVEVGRMSGSLVNLSLPCNVC